MGVLLLTPHLLILGVWPVLLYRILNTKAHPLKQMGQFLAWLLTPPVLYAGIWILAAFPIGLSPHTDERMYDRILYAGSHGITIVLLITGSLILSLAVACRARMLPTFWVAVGSATGAYWLALSAVPAPVLGSLRFVTMLMLGGAIAGVATLFSVRSRVQWGIRLLSGALAALLGAGLGERTGAEVAWTEDWRTPLVNGLGDMVLELALTALITGAAAVWLAYQTGWLPVASGATGAGRAPARSWWLALGAGLALLAGMAVMPESALSSLAPTPQGPPPPTHIVGDRITPDTAAWLTATRVITTQHEGVNIAFVPQTGQLVTAYELKPLALWDHITTNPTVVRTWPVRSNQVILAVAPDSKVLIIRGQATTEVDLWRIADGALLQTFRGATDHLVTGIFTPDGTRVLAGGDDGVVYMWNVEDGRLLRTFPVAGHVEALACSSDGQTLAVAVSEFSTALLRLADGQTIRTLPEAGAGGMVFTPDGHTLAQATGHVVQLWDWASGEKQDLSEWGSADAIALSPDGQVVAARSGEYLRLWRVADGAALARFPATVSRIGFAPDGRALVTTGLYDQDVQVWTVR